MSTSVAVTEVQQQVIVEESGVRIVSVGTQGPPGGRVPVVVTPTWASTIIIDWSQADVARIIAEGPTTLVFTGAVDGQRVLVEVTQGAPGGHVITWPGGINYSSTITGLVTSIDSGKRDKFGFVYNATSTTYDVIALAIGF